ncbi:MAG: GNAT family N-acetyltransferase [Elainella sp.]
MSSSNPGSFDPSGTLSSPAVDPGPSPAPTDSAYRPAACLTPAHAASTSRFLVRTVRQQDLPALAEVLASSFHGQEGWGRWLYPLLRAGIHEDLRSRLHTRGPHYACLVAINPCLRERILSEVSERATPTAASLLAGRADLLLGSVEMNLKAPPLLQPWSDKYLYLSNLAVRADYRRQGVAQELLRMCEQVALGWGFQDLYLHVLENNHPARRLYRKAGYRVQRIEVNPLSLLLGQSRQLFLHKRLPAIGS